MDRITHQSPRQRGYGSTSSLRNDSLKHTQKHEKGREESDQEAKLAASGGPSGQAGRTVQMAARTVRQDTADYPHPCHGLSVLAPRTVRKSKQNLQRRPRITDRPRGARGLSARHQRTVCPVHADRPKLRPTKTQSHDGSKLKASKNTKNTRRTGTVRTVHLVLADRPRGADRAENARP
jgi:hypothetical protein